MYPTEIVLSEDEIAKLTKAYQRTYAEILNEIEGATDFGVANRKNLLSQIEGHLEELGKQAQGIIEAELPRQYKDGATEAVMQLKNADAPIRVGAGFSRIHQDAIKALVADTSKAFGESLTGVARSADQIINKATKQEITMRLASGQIKGEALREVKKSVMGAIQQQGLYALMDKGGHTWTLDRYTEMLIRTKSVEARNRGLMNRVVENNYDLVQVSSHGASDACGQWEGKILSVSGKTKGVPTLSEAEGGGLFHPNCKHAINVMRPELAKQTMGWDSKNKRYTKGLTTKPSTVKQPPKPTVKVPTRTVLNKVFKVGNKEYKFNSYETRLEKAHPISYSGKPTSARGYAGQFTSELYRRKLEPEANILRFSRTGLKRADNEIEWTFRHETGHFVDARTLEPNLKTIRGIDVYSKSRLSATTEFKEAVKPEYAQTVINRRVRGWFSGKDITDENISDLMKGRQIKLDNEIYRITPKHRKYLRQYDELFAEFYADYRINPADFAKRMPEVYNYFEKVVK